MPTWPLDSIIILLSGIHCNCYLNEYVSLLPPIPYITPSLGYIATTMPTYKATHIPYGLSDHSKRTISNPGIKDEVIFEEYGIETGGESFSTRVLVKGGGGERHL